MPFRLIEMTPAAGLPRLVRCAGSAGVFLTTLALAGCTSEADSASGPRVEGGAVGVDGAHEHGVVRAGFAVDRARLTLDLEVPGDAVFGFEHAPASDEERRTVVEALARLQENAGRLVAFGSDVRCAVDSVEVLEAPDLDESTHEEYGHEHDDDAGHEGDGAHSDDPEAAGTEHSEVRMTVVWSCSASPEGIPATLQFRDVLPDAELVDLTVITSQGQAGGRVAADAAFSF